MAEAFSEVLCPAMWSLDGFFNCVTYYKGSWVMFLNLLKAALRKMLVWKHRGSGLGGLGGRARRRNREADSRFHGRVYNFVRLLWRHPTSDRRRILYEPWVLKTIVGVDIQAPPMCQSPIAALSCALFDWRTKVLSSWVYPIFSM